MEEQTVAETHAVRDVRQTPDGQEIITRADPISAPPTTPQPPVITAEAIAAFERSQTEAFAAEYEALCEKYKRVVKGRAQLVDGRIVAIEIIAVLPQ